MLKGQRLSMAKGLLLEWTHQLYQQRADLLVWVFGGDRVDRVYGPAKCRAFNDAWITPIRGGGGTPLRQAVAQADALLRAQRKKRPNQAFYLWLMTDGRTPHMPDMPQHADNVSIIDCEQAGVPLGRAQILAKRWGAKYYPLEYFTVSA